MISESVPQVLAEQHRIESDRYSFWARLAFIALGLGLTGWLWPYQLSNLPEYIGSTGWMLGWFTALVLLGAVSGYMLRSRWSILLVPLGLYAGGVVHWFQYEWGPYIPEWTPFLIVSGLALGVLLITAGAAAGIAARVFAVESAQAAPTEGIRLSAALAALLGLLAITVVNTLPTPWVGALLGLAALLAGAGLMEEEQVNVRERFLAIAGMLVGVVAIGTQLLSLWSVVKNF